MVILSSIDKYNIREILTYRTFRVFIHKYKYFLKKKNIFFTFNNTTICYY